MGLWYRTEISYQANTTHTKKSRKASLLYGFWLMYRDSGGSRLCPYSSWLVGRYRISLMSTSSGWLTA